MASSKSKSGDQLEIRRAAYSMIDNHGMRAADVALRRARNLGPELFDSRQTWERIVAEIAHLQGSSATARI